MVSAFLSIIALLILVVFIIIGTIIWLSGYKEFRTRNGTYKDLLIYCIIGSIILTIIGNVVVAVNKYDSEEDKYGLNSPRAQLISHEAGDNVNGTINIIVQFTDEGGNLEKCEVWLSQEPDGNPIPNAQWKQKKDKCDQIIIAQAFDTTSITNGKYYINVYGEDSTEISCDGYYAINVDN